MIKHHNCLLVGFLLPSNIYIRFNFPLFKETDQLQTFKKKHQKKNGLKEGAIQKNGGKRGGGGVTRNILVHVELT